MEKYYEEWKGKQFPVREVMLPVFDDMNGKVNVYVADYELYAALEDDINAKDIDARLIDEDIYFYCDSGFIASDPTDEEIVEYLFKHVY